MTIGEIVSYFKTFKEEKEAEQQAQLYISYQTAILTARFVGDCLNGEQPPTFYEVFPTLAQDSEISKKLEEQRNNMIKNQ